MKQKLITPILIVIALVTILATLIHGMISDISIFHGMVIHPLILLASFSLFAFVKKQQSENSHG